MQSYRTDVTGAIIGFHGCEIGLCVWILYEKRWGKIQFNGKLRSQQWWRNRLQDLIDHPKLIKFGESIIWDGKPAEPAPIPFEIEMGMPDLDYQTLLKAWKRYEEKRKR